jgi:hypothetical protein
MARSTVLAICEHDLDFGSESVLEVVAKTLKVGYNCGWNPRPPASRLFQWQTTLS